MLPRGVSLLGRLPVELADNDNSLLLRLSDQRYVIKESLLWLKTTFSDPVLGLEILNGLVTNTGELQAQPSYGHDTYNYGMKLGKEFEEAKFIHVVLRFCTVKYDPYLRLVCVKLDQERIINATGAVKPPNGCSRSAYLWYLNLKALEYKNGWLVYTSIEKLRILERHIHYMGDRDAELTRLERIIDGAEDRCKAEFNSVKQRCDYLSYIFSQLTRLKW